MSVKSRGYKKFINCRLKAPEINAIDQRKDREGSVARLVCERTVSQPNFIPASDLQTSFYAADTISGDTDTLAYRALGKKAGEVACYTCPFADMDQLQATEYKLSVARNAEELALTELSRQKAVDELNANRPVTQLPYA